MNVNSNEEINQEIANLISTEIPQSPAHPLEGCIECKDLNLNYKDRPICTPPPAEVMNPNWFGKHDATELPIDYTYYEAKEPSTINLIPESHQIQDILNMDENSLQYIQNLSLSHSPISLSHSPKENTPPSDEMVNQNELRTKVASPIERIKLREIMKLSSPKYPAINQASSNSSIIINRSSDTKKDIIQEKEENKNIELRKTKKFKSSASNPQNNTKNFMESSSLFKSFKLSSLEALRPIHNQPTGGKINLNKYENSKDSQFTSNTSPRRKSNPLKQRKNISTINQQSQSSLTSETNIPLSNEELPSYIRIPKYSQLATSYLDADEPYPRQNINSSIVTDPIRTQLETKEQENSFFLNSSSSSELNVSLSEGVLPLTSISMPSISELCLSDTTILSGRLKEVFANKNHSTVDRFVQDKSNLSKKPLKTCWICELTDNSVSHRKGAVR